MFVVPHTLWSYFIWKTFAVLCKWLLIINFAGGTHSRNNRVSTALHCKLAMDRPASVEQDASVDDSTGSTRKRRNRAKCSFPDVCF